MHEGAAVRSAEMDMIAAATRSNVSVYSIDPRGLSTGMEDAITIGSIPAAAPEGSDANTIARAAAGLAPTHSLR